MDLKLRLYRLVLILLTPVFALRSLLHLIRGTETFEGLAQRLGRGPVPDTLDKVIWLHGASLGELTSARALIEYMLGQNPGLQIVATANSYSGRGLIAGWKLDRLHSRLAPLDSKGSVDRFLRKWHPGAAFTLENEIWPTRILACQTADIPFVVLGGRMSAGSAANWARVSGFTKKVMGAISAISPLDAENAARFENLGVAADQIGSPANLKASVRLPAPDNDQFGTLSRLFNRENTIMAASTHAGEDEVILNGFKAAQSRNPDLRLILTPRHPDRGDTVERLISASGLIGTRRSSGTLPNINTDVYLTDTIGEMPLWYSLSAITIVCGSLADKGGHTPIEPVQFGSVVVHGPFISNHSTAFAALHKNQAAFGIEDANELGKLLTKLTQCKELDDIARRATMALTSEASMTAQPGTMLHELDKLCGGNLLPALLC